ncbi:MAG TPA: TonB-dependent receptor [Rhizomicrobium sp.]|jgi:iron complex outermembrane receptor protein
MARFSAFGAICAAALLSTFGAQAQTAPPSENNSVFAPQGAIEEVVVTARRRPEDAQKIPVAVTAISGETLRRDAIKSAIDLQNFAPSLSVAANLGSRDDDVFTIRGQSQPFGGADPGVQTYFAEVPYNGSGPGSEYDMDNIQVLNGPQGTLFGRNTTGGAVLFEPKRPELGAAGGYVDGTFGNYDDKELQSAINLPLGDSFAIRIAADVASRNGYTHDISNGEDLDNVNYQAYRVGALWQPFAHFQNYAVFDYLHDDNNGTSAELTGVNTSTIDNLASQFLGAPCTVPPASPTCAALQGFEQAMLGALAQQQALGPRKTTSDIPLFFRRQAWGATDIARYDLNEHFYLRNIFGYRVNKEQPSFDYDGSALPILDIPNSRAWESNSYQVTEEFQIGDSSPGDALNWILGFYHELDHPNGYSEVERQTLGGFQPPNPFNPLSGFGDTEIDSLVNGGTSTAVYGSATYDASNWVRGLSFTAGGRYTWDHKFANSLICVLPDPAAPALGACPYPLTPASAGVNAIDQSANFRAPTWTLAANYQVTDDTMVYATYRRGYKSGGFNSGAGAATDYAEFKPEYLTDVEIGTKNNWTILGVPGRTDFDAYYGWYNDVQKNNEIAVVQELAAPPFVEVEPAALTFNAARATIKGVEFSSTFVPDENFEVNVFYSYTDATYDKFVLPQEIVIDPAGGQTALGLSNHVGDPFAYTPRNKFGITPRIHIPIDSSLGRPYLSATLYYQSKEWFTDLSDIETTCSAFTPPPAAGAPYTCLAPGGEQPDQKSYTLLNLRFDWDNFLGKPLDLSLFMNNVTNQTYKVGGDALLHLTGTSASIYGPPRMFGVELRYRFGADAHSPDGD